MASLNKAIANGLKDNGYKYKTTKGAGVVYSIRPETFFRIQIKLEFKLLGQTVHTLRDTTDLGYAYSWMTKRTSTTYNTVRLVKTAKEGVDVFGVAEMPLGGNVETLG